jgi:hypothetical protein
MKATERLLEVFAEIQTEAAKDRWCSNLSNYVGHMVINGITYEVTISLENDLDEMLVDPMDKTGTKLEA